MRNLLIPTLLAVGAVLASCATGVSDDPSASQADTPTGPDAGTPGNPNVLKGSGARCGGSTAPGCSCGTVGATVSCWTGPPELRNQGSCHDGTQTCVGAVSSEVSGGSWGPCEGQELGCASKPNNPPMVTDAGSPISMLVCANPDVPGNDNGTPCCVTCRGCVPGSVAWCYDSCIGPPEYCVMTVQQTCNPDGTWGPCTETGQGYVDGCIHFWDGCDLNGGAGSYAGNCDSVLAGCSAQFSSLCPGSLNTGDFGSASPLPGLDGGVGK